MRITLVGAARSKAASDAEFVHDLDI